MTKKFSFLRIIDKVIMTAIIGGAVGSVLGMTLAPKPGKETRALLKQSWHRRRGLLRRIIGIFFGRKDSDTILTELPDESIYEEKKR